MYTDARVTERIYSVLQHPEIVYAGSTKGIRSKGRIYLDTEEKITGGDLCTSGTSFYFVSVDNENSIENYLRYYDEITKVIEMMPDESDGRYKFPNAHTDNLSQSPFLR